MNLDSDPEWEKVSRTEIDKITSDDLKEVEDSHASHKVSVIPKPVVETLV